MSYKYEFSATLEFENAQPETIRGEHTAASHPSAFRDVMNKLLEAHPKRQPSSIVIVMLSIQWEEPNPNARTEEEQANIRARMARARAGRTNKSD